MTRRTFANEVSHIHYGKTPEEHRAYMRWWRHENKEDYNKKRLEWAKNNLKRRREQARISHLKQKFNITVKEFDDLLERQNNKCAICGLINKDFIDIKGRERPKLFIDHCHKTGRVRGLLCYDCNLGIGHLKDSVELLNKAKVYLKLHNTNRRQGREV